MFIVFLTTLAICLMPVQALAQNIVTITGRVLDTATQAPLPYANVQLNPAVGTEMIAGASTDSSGRFILRRIQSGEYRVSCSFMGYKVQELNVFIGERNQNYDLGDIGLERRIAVMDNVTVQAERPGLAATMEKKTYAMDDNIARAGGSVLDAVRNLPSVTVDPEGKVFLRGSDKVMILIDGQQSSLTGFGNQKGLENIPSGNVDHIEIITNPSAQYQASGMAGIINIIFKEQTAEGLNIDFGLATGIGEFNERRRNLPDISDKYSFTPKLIPNFGVNYRAKKLNYFLLADGMVHRHLNSNTFTSRNYEDRPDIQSQFLENRTQQFYNIKGGLDWFIDDANTLTLYALWEDEYHIDRGDVPYDDAASGDRKRLWTWREDERTLFINYAGTLRHRFVQPGHEISGGYLYTGGGEDELFPFTDTSEYRNSVDETHLKVFEYVHAMTMDYVKPLATGKFETGMKVTLRNIPIDYVVRPGENTILDLNLGDWSRYEEDIYAVYTNYLKESKWFDVEAGIRLEPTRVHYKIDSDNQYYPPKTEDNYFEMFPNIRLTYKADVANRFSLFYNRRIDRPGEFDLRPFPKYDDPEILKTGNPALRPQLTDAIEAAYRNIWSTGSAYVSVYYRHINDIFSRVYTSDTMSSEFPVVHAIPHNLGDGANLGFEVNGEQSLTASWQINGSVNWYRNRIDAASGAHVYPQPQDFAFPKSENNTWNFKCNSLIHFPRNIDWQVTGIYYAADIIPQGKIRARYSVDMGLKMKTINGNIEYFLSATDLFNGFSLKKKITSEGFTLYERNYYETQSVTAGVRIKL